MAFLLATNNEKKQKELAAILAGLEILTLSDVGIMSNPDETSDTFEQNALTKAWSACRVSGMPAIADDSGLVVDALDGAPGTRSARYCEGSDEDRTALLLKNMENVPGDKRTARFVAAVAAVFPDGREIVVRGECEGIILRETRGENGFGYDPVFFVPEENGTFSEITEETKNRISHRAKALQKLRAELKKAGAIA